MVSVNQNAPRMVQPLLGRKATAKMLGISTRQLARETAPKGQLACIRIGRSVRYKLSDLIKYSESERATKETASEPIPLEDEKREAKAQCFDFLESTGSEMSTLLANFGTLQAMESEGHLVGEDLKTVAAGFDRLANEVGQFTQRSYYYAADQAKAVETTEQMAETIRAFLDKAPNQAMFDKVKAAVKLLLDVKYKPLKSKSAA